VSVLTRKRQNIGVEEEITYRNIQKYFLVKINDLIIIYWAADGGPN